MIEGLYSGASAMQMLAQQQELISKNLMHVNTSGHRRAVAGVQKRFDEQNLDTSIDLGPEIETVAQSFEVGRMVNTGRHLDVGIMTDGFFAFGQGDAEYFSRNGRFFRDADSGQLVNEDGIPVQGEGGLITIDTDIPDQSIVIAQDGTISANGEEIGKLRTVAFEDNRTLVPYGDTKFTRGEDTVESQEAVRMGQFQHELSNTQPVMELVALIVNNRQYEAVQKASRSLSEAMSEYIQA
jgi:flagellar basal-body rod protein FlgF